MQKRSNALPSRTLLHNTPDQTSERALSFPIWFPEPIKGIAQEQHEHAINAGTNEVVQLVGRLVTDPRMKRVWMELFKRCRDEAVSLSPFFHGLNGADEAAQWSAIRFLFKEV